MIKFTQKFANIFKFLKSGMLFDFILKKMLLFISKKLFSTFNIWFNEKYFIENIFFKPSKLLAVLSSYLRSFSNVFASRYVAVLIIINFLLIIYLS